jgi:endoglucanase
VAAFQRPFVDLGDVLVAKSIDDRIGCAILVETLKQLSDSPHEVHFVFTVQEEVGTRGATTAAYKVHPDVSIAIDVTDSGDVPERKHFDVKMGHGPAIKVMDVGMLAHAGLKQWMIDTATKSKIPYQLEILTLPPMHALCSWPMKVVRPERSQFRVATSTRPPKWSVTAT